MKYGKRRTDPEKWLIPRFRKLPPTTKLVYLYLLDNCDWAGFMPVDVERIVFDTQIADNNIIQILEELNKDEIVLKDGWLFVLDFIELQDNNPLNPNNNAHKNILNKLRDNSKFMDSDVRFEKNVAPYQPLLRDTSNSNSNCISKGNSIGNGTPQTDSSNTTFPQTDSSNTTFPQTDSSNTTIKEKKENKSIWKMNFACTLCGAKNGEYCNLKDENIPCMAHQPYNNSKDHGTKGFLKKQEKYK